MPKSTAHVLQPSTVTGVCGGPAPICTTPETELEKLTKTLRSPDLVAQSPAALGTLGPHCLRFSVTSHYASLTVQWEPPIPQAVQEVAALANICNLCRTVSPCWHQSNVSVLRHPNQPSRLSPQCPCLENPQRRKLGWYSRRKARLTAGTCTRQAKAGGAVDAMGLLQLIGLAGVPKTLHQLFRRKRRPDASSKQEIEENAEELLDPSGPPLSCQAANSFDFDRSCPSNEHSPFSDTVALNNKNKKRASNEYQRISSWTSSSLATSRVTGAPSMLRRHESPPRGQQNCPVVPQTNDNADAGPSNSRNDRMPDRMSITVGDNVSCDLGLLSLQSGSHEAVVEPKGERRSSIYESDDPIGMAQKARHQCFTNEALGMVCTVLLATPFLFRWGLCSP